METERNRKIGIFGGTFDPSHEGHVDMASGLIASRLLDHVLFVPSAFPPHKPSAPVSDFRHRVNMLRIAIETRKELGISEIELEIGRNPSYTYYTIEALEGKSPGDHLYLVMGSDSIRQLHTWHRCQEILDRWDLIVYPRDGYIPQKDELMGWWDLKRTSKILGSIHLLKEYDVSSTAIRKMIRGKQNIGNLLNPKVYDYILKNSLYQNGEKNV